MIILNHAGSLSYTISTIRTTTYCHCEKKLWETRFCKGRGSQERERREGYVRPNGRWEVMLGVAAPVLAVVCKQMTTAVKRLNRYFCFLLLGFHLPVRKKWAKMYKSVSQHSYLSIFLKILSFFR